MNRFKEPTKLEINFGLALEKLSTHYHELWNEHEHMKNDFQIGYILGEFTALGKVLGFSSDFLHDIHKQQSDLAELGQ